MSTPPDSTAKVETITWPGALAAVRPLPEETPVALTYDHTTFAVMMASPRDLQEFAIGFSYSEGIIETAADITAFEIAYLPDGIECRMDLAPAWRNALEKRRRHIAGPAGCGLCGMDSLAEAIRKPRLVTSTLTIQAGQIAAVMARLPSLQNLNAVTRAVHAAAFYNPVSDAILLREDVGRHNALDKVIGALHRAGMDPAAGILLLTSRVSIELIQKAAMLGVGIVVAVSVPTARAVRDADAAGITLIAVARDDGYEIFTHAQRVIL